MDLKSIWRKVELVLFSTQYNTVSHDRASSRCSNSCKVLKKVANF
jgi:hypothetical protein